MKAKAISQNTICRKKFFLLMIAPFLIGVLIIMTSMARAEWNQSNDPSLSHSPKQQGWALMTYPKPSHLIQEEAPVAFAAR